MDKRRDHKVSLPQAAEEADARPATIAACICLSYLPSWHHQPHVTNEKTEEQREKVTNQGTPATLELPADPVHPHCLPPKAGGRP